MMKKLIGYKIRMMAITKISSITIGSKLKSAILKIEAKDCEPLDTILITFPVSLLRWKAKL